METNSLPFHSGRICQMSAAKRVATELDIYRNANILVKRYGQDAPIHVAMRGDAMLEKQDMEGRAMWLALNLRGSDRGVVFHHFPQRRAQLP